MNNPRLRKYWPMAPVLFLLILAVWVLCMPEPYLPLTWSRIQQERDAIDRTSRSIEQTLNGNQALANELAALTEIRDYSIQLPEKAAGVLFRERLEKGVAATGLRTRSMGDVRKIDIAANIFLFEVTFAADGQIGDLTKFMDSMYRDKPRVYWKNITIKPNSLTQPEFISITATLSALDFSPESAGSDAPAAASAETAAQPPAASEAAPDAVAPAVPDAVPDAVGGENTETGTP